MESESTLNQQNSVNVVLSPCLVQLKLTKQKPRERDRGEKLMNQHSFGRTSQNVTLYSKKISKEVDVCSTNRDGHYPSGL